MRLTQQTPLCSDFDVTLTGEDAPAFRVLLPERVRGQGWSHQGLCHVIPGSWDIDAQGADGRFTVAAEVEVTVGIRFRVTDILVDLGFRNLTRETVTDVWTNVCVSVNHLPGVPGWANPRFLPGLPLDRTIQGRHWYEVATPERLLALTSRGWAPMHPSPDAPSAEGVLAYRFVVSPQAEASACAVEAAEGGEFLYQAWSAPCRWFAPFPGNACMHLEPFVAEDIAPGGVARVSGLVGVYRGNREELSALVQAFRAGRL